MKTTRLLLIGSSSAPKSDIYVNPNTGEIMAASMFIYSDVEKLLHKWRLIETGAVKNYQVFNRTLFSAI